MKNKEEVQKRVSKIKGQVEGVERMIDAERGCMDIVQQIVAIDSAIKKVGVEILKDESYSCLNEKKKMDRLVETLFKLK